MTRTHTVVIVVGLGVLFLTMFVAAFCAYQHVYEGAEGANKTPDPLPEAPMSAVPDAPVTEVTGGARTGDRGYLPSRDWQASRRLRSSRTPIPTMAGRVDVVHLPGGPGMNEVVRISYDGKVVKLHH